MTKADEVYKLLRQTGILSRVPVKAGTRVITFEYELALFPGQDGTFNLQLWAPLVSFQVVPQGQVVASIQTPGSTFGFRSQLIEASGWIPDAQGNPTTQLDPVINSDLGLHHVFAWRWENDPFFRIQYRYI